MQPTRPPHSVDRGRHGLTGEAGWCGSGVWPLIASSPRKPQRAARGGCWATVSARLSSAPFTVSSSSGERPSSAQWWHSASPVLGATAAEHPACPGPWRPLCLTSLSSLANSLPPRKPPHPSISSELLGSRVIPILPGDQEQTRILVALSSAPEI